MIIPTIWAIAAAVNVWIYSLSNNPITGAVIVFSVLMAIVTAIFEARS